MSKIDDLIKELCPDGVKFIELGSLCSIETGRRDANEAVSDGQFLFFTTARENARIDSFRWNCEALLVAGNANVGNVKHYVGKFDAYQRTYVLTGFPQEIDVRYLYYALRNNLNHYLESRKNVAAMTYIVLGTLEAFLVPIPPVKVQKEIVSILDKFTQLEAELEAELEARRTQYEVTRGRLLDFSADLKSHPLSKLIQKLCPEGVPAYKLAHLEDQRVIKLGRGDVISRNDLAEYPGHFPVYSSSALGKGEFGRYGKYMFDDERITWSVDGGGKFFYREPHKYSVTNVAGWIKVLNEHVISCRYLYFVLLNTWSTRKYDYIVKAHPSVIREDYEVPVPPIEVQKEIVSILDKLDSLCSDITIGLPAEIAARRKQYEYYRNKLLTFKELDAA